MRVTIILLLLIFVINLPGLFAQNATRQLLVFTGIRSVKGVWQLLFTDKKNSKYQFGAKQSNTAPYVFYTTGVDGTLTVNERIKSSWFWVSYNTLIVEKRVVKRIVKIERVHF